jgi:transcriptional regulator with PAS, ATPase and Fis domain
MGCKRRQRAVHIGRSSEIDLGMSALFMVAVMEEHNRLETGSLSEQSRCERIIRVLRQRRHRKERREGCTLQPLLHYLGPATVRELETVIERAMIHPHEPLADRHPPSD